MFIIAFICNILYYLYMALLLIFVAIPVTIYAWAKRNLKRLRCDLRKWHRWQFDCGTQKYTKCLDCDILAPEGMTDEEAYNNA